MFFHYIAGVFFVRVLLYRVLSSFVAGVLLQQVVGRYGLVGYGKAVSGVIAVGLMVPPCGSGEEVPAYEVGAPAGTRNFVMFFGEFKGDENVEGKDIVINWNDGSDCDTVTFSHSYTTTGGTPQTATTVQLNHKPATLPITFVKER